MDNDIRWVQRFQNFEKSFLLLSNAIQNEHQDVVYRAGIIQFFEMCFKLAWKTMKDYLEGQGFDQISSPRDTIKIAFQNNLIIDGHLWLQALDDRNLTVHTYDESTAQKLEELIRNLYFPMISKLITYLKLRLP
ncbi:MAG: nucleotidyltransferase substrate binding protein [Bacteroidales bacterium]|jgi:nucleotidyltransferase substrate binding protein (TIGR01987 family)|nr:nucleotidyltransferase substrate binding protein [Bacteroidales bacterium]